MTMATAPAKYQCLFDGLLNRGQYVFTIHTALALDVVYNRRQFVVYGHLVAPLLLSKNNKRFAVIPLNHRETMQILPNYGRLVNDKRA